MSNKYWGRNAGGSSTGTWDASSVTNWFDDLARTVRSTVAPTSLDDVFFDGASDNGVAFTVTLSTGAVCRDITAAGLVQVMTLAGTTAWSIYGSPTFPATNFNRTYAGTVNFLGAGTFTITMNGLSLTTGLVTFNNASGNWILGSAFVKPGVITQTAGNIDLNGYSFTCTTTYNFTQGAIALSGADLTLGQIVSANSNVRSIAFGSNKIVVTGNSGSIWTLDTITNLSISGEPRVEFPSGGTGTRSVRHGTVAGGSESNAISVYVTGGTDIFNLALDANKSRIKHLDFTGFAGVTSSCFPFLYGDLTYSPAMTLSVSSTLHLRFASALNEQKVKFNGKSADFWFIQETSGSGSVKLLDDMTLGATRNYNHNSGTLNLNNNKLNAGVFSSTGAVARHIDTGTSGEIHVASNFTASGSNLTTSGTGLISMDSASAKTFAGGGFSWPTLNQGGAGDLNITGANRFKDMTNTVAPCAAVFPANVTTQVENFSLNGTPGNVVSIRSSVAGQRFGLEKVAA